MIDLKKLLGKRRLTGTEAGQAILYDLCLAYNDSQNLLTNEQKSKLIDKLATSDDVRVYSEYREIHNTVLNLRDKYYIANTLIVYNSTSIFSLFSDLFNLETSSRQMALFPRLATGEEAKSPSKKNVAVMQGGTPLPELLYCLDAAGYYVPTDLPDAHMADIFLPEHEQCPDRLEVTKKMDELCSAALSANAISAVFDIIADVVGVPEVKTLILKSDPTKLYSSFTGKISKIEGTIYRVDPKTELQDETRTAQVKQAFRDWWTKHLVCENTDLKPGDVQKAREFASTLSNIYMFPTMLCDIAMGEVSP